MKNNLTGKKNNLINNSNRVRDIIQHGGKLLQAAKIENRKKEIQWYFQKKLSWGLAEFVLNKSKKLSDVEKKEFFSFVNQRAKGVPFQYIINSATFYGEEFFVDQSVLIPRPETELIIKTAKNKGPYITSLDIGTGSGNLAIILSIKKIAMHIDAFDISIKALKIAKRNCNNYKTKNIQLKQFDFLKNKINKTYDLVISNPPYISLESYQKLEDSIKLYEPQIALTDYKDGFIFYKHFAKNLQTILNPKGRAILEIGEDKTHALIEKLFIKEQFRCIWHQDLQGNNRVIEVYR